MIRLEYLTNGDWKPWTKVRTLSEARKLVAERINKSSVVRIVVPSHFTSLADATYFLLDRYHKDDEGGEVYLAGVDSLTTNQVRSINSLLKKAASKQ